MNLTIQFPKISVKSAMPLVNVIMMTVLYLAGFDLKWPFVFFVVMTYALLFPKKLFNPKNIVFGYYFMWYCLAPVFANRYRMMCETYGGDRVNAAYMMCFTTYSVAMFTLEYFIGESENAQVNKYNERKGYSTGCAFDNEVRLGFVATVAMMGMLIIGITVYVNKTGGLSAWVESANNAFFNRGGAGLFYILFTHALLLLLFFEGQREKIGYWSYFRRALYIVLLFACYTFIGSRSTTFMMILVLFADKIIKLDTLDKKSFGIITMGAVIFVIGMIIRLGDLMRVSLKVSLNQILNYFDTFENLLIMLRDFPPDLGKTFFLPLNWPFVKLGFTGVSKFYDMSIWLTTEYYPESWINGGTTQWPIESDMYLSFLFWGGIPVLFLYFGIIAYLYKRAQNKGCWQFIYVMEGFYIISHLRGGFLIYWYYWLIPIYLALVLKQTRADAEKCGQGV